MKKFIKIIAIFSILTLLLVLISTPVQADIGINPEGYNPGKLTLEESERAVTMAGKVLGIIRNCGIIVSVIALSIIGLKYMLGSLDEKANYKENMIPYIIGCALVAACTIIPSIIYSIATKAQ